MLTKIDGYKTYIVCTVTILFAIVELWSKAIPLQEAVNMILAAFAGIGFRSAMNK